MKTKPILLLLTLTSFSYVVSAVAFPQRPITHGITIPEKDYNYFVQISKDRGGKPVCGGTLIEKNFIITAAHCVTYREVKKEVNKDTGEETKKITNKVLDDYQDNITIYFDKSSGSEVRRVSKIYLPANFEVMGKDIDDIALLKLDKPIENIQPIRLNFQNNYIGKEAQVIGYGLTSGYKEVELMNVINFPDELQSTYIDILSPDHCNLKNNTNFICAISKVDLTSTEPYNPYSNASMGDSGGPLLLNNADGSTQIGVTVGGLDYALDNRYGVYANIAKYKDFIEGIIKN